MTKKLIYLLVIVSFMAALIASGASAKSQNVLDPNTQFYVPKANKGATEQIADPDLQRQESGCQPDQADDPDTTRGLVHPGHSQERPAGCEEQRRARRR